MLVANTRSVKGKTTELTSLALHHDIICLTETHIDSNITDKQILYSNKHVIFRHDRNVNGGGVLIAIDSQIKATKIDLDIFNQEIGLIKIEEHTILGCYYRPNVSLPVTPFKLLLEEMNNRLPTYQVLITGDFNFPGKLGKP